MQLRLLVVNEYIVHLMEAVGPIVMPQACKSCFLIRDNIMQVASIDAKLLGALLAGVRRAFPFVDPSETEALMEEHSAALFKITHTATFGVAVQALSLVFQLLDARSAVSDRFYRYSSGFPIPLASILC